MKKDRNIVIANDLVCAYVTAHNTEKKMAEKQAELKPEFLKMGLGTYIYKGKEKITNCVTVSEVHGKKTIVTNQEKFDELQQQIDALKRQQAQYTATVANITIRATVTAMPKAINEMLKKGEI